MIRRPPRSTLNLSSAASDVYKRQRVGFRVYLRVCQWGSRIFPDENPVPQDHRRRLLHGKTQPDYFRTLDYRKDHPEKGIPGTGKTIDKTHA